jgi:hypothetical protein
VAKASTKVVTHCPSPRCGKPIYSDHSNSWCIECGEPLPDNVQEQIPQLRALREMDSAAGYKHKEQDPQSPDTRWVVLFIVLGLFVAIVVVPDSSWGVVGLIVIFVLWFVARRAAEDLRDSRRYDSLPQDKVECDQRPLVLYLRSFIADGIMPKRSEIISILSALANPLTLLFVALRPDQSYEELLTVSLQKVGPVVTLAKPYENLQELGATRLRVEGEWQAKIDDLLRRCVLVVFNGSCSSHSEGLWWEFRRMVEVVPLTRAVIFFPLNQTDRALREIEYQNLKARMEVILGRELPPVIGKHQCVYFNQGEQPCLAKNIDIVLKSIDLSRDGRPTRQVERTADAAAQR